MNDQNKENIDRLMAGFLAPETAAAASEDIRKGDEIFNSNPAPQPDVFVLADIKDQIGKRLQNQHSVTPRQIAYKFAAVAAVVILALFIGTRFSTNQQAEKQSVARQLPEIIWEITSSDPGDGTEAMLAAEIEEIEGNILAAGLGESENENDLQIDELEFELELIAINGNFWKG